MWPGYRYSQWDNSQSSDSPNFEELFDALSDEVLQYGDFSRALRHFLQRGFSSQSGQQLGGVQDMLRQLRQQRRDLLGQHNLDSLYEDIKQRLDDLLQKERNSIQDRLQRGAPDGATDNVDAALQDLYERMARKNLEKLDNLSSTVPEAIEELKEYEFLDPEAGAAYQELLQMLQKSVLDSFFRNLTQRLQQVTPQDLQEMQDMVGALNDLLQERQRGGNPKFGEFMQEFGHMFGPNPPQSLDELLQRLRSQMSQTQSLLNSLSPDQRESLLDALGARLFDEDLQRELAQLAANLDQVFPNGVRGQDYPFFGEDDVSLAQGMDLMEQLEQMEELGRQLDRTRFGAPLDEIDQDLLKRVLGDEASQDLEELQKIAKQLEESGYVERQGNELKLTPHAVRKIGQKALRDIFQRMRKDVLGNHPTQHQGFGTELADQTKTYEFGDPFNLHLQKTVYNAVRRNSAGARVELTPADFEVYNTEHHSRTSTVLVLDLSRSMPMRGNFVAAKKVALALSALIRTQFPRDNLYLVGFSGFARRLDKDELAHLNVGEFGRGTNIQGALRVARNLLSRHRNSQRQVVMITDGEPTAFFEQDGHLAIEYPPGPRVLRETLTEVKRCTKDDITINTFMLERSYHLRSFVNQLTRANKGRVLFASADELGEYILVDYVGRKNRRATA